MARVVATASIWCVSPVVQQTKFSECCGRLAIFLGSNFILINPLTSASATSERDAIDFEWNANNPLKSQSHVCTSGCCTLPSLSLFEMAELRKKAREKAKCT